jgi:hypothetical protein
LFFLFERFLFHPQLFLDALLPFEFAVFLYFSFCRFLRDFPLLCGAFTSLFTFQLFLFFGGVEYASFLGFLLFHRKTFLTEAEAGRVDRGEHMSLDDLSAQRTMVHDAFFALARQLDPSRKRLTVSTNWA